MKLKTFIAMAAITLFVACSSTKYRATDTGLMISASAAKAFDQQYPNATNVVWGSYDPNIVILNDWELAEWDVIDKNDYVVRFDMDGEKYYAWYDEYGNWVGSAYVVNDYATLPASVTSAVKTQYPGYAITSVNKEFHKERAAYEVVLKNNDTKMVVLMDMNGNVIKSKTKPL